MPPTSVKEPSAAVDPNEVVEEKKEDGDDQVQNNHLLNNPADAVNDIRDAEKQHQGTQIETSECERQGRQIFRDMVLSSRAAIEEREKRLPVSIHLQQMANSVLSKHRMIYSDMVNELQLDNGGSEDGLNYKTLEFMSDELFAAEGGVTWGRIVALCSFCIELERQCQERKLEHIPLYVADSIWHYNSDRITHWISQQAKGWDTVIEVYPDGLKKEGGVFKTLLYAGIGMAAMASVIKVVR